MYCILALSLVVTCILKYIFLFWLHGILLSWYSSILSGLSFTFCICLAVYVVSTASSCQDLWISIFSPDHASVKIFTWMFHTHILSCIAQTEQLFSCSAHSIIHRQIIFLLYFHLVTNSTIYTSNQIRLAGECHSRFLYHSQFPTPNQTQSPPNILYALSVMCLVLILSVPPQFTVMPV